jgi:hypothetical protein
MPPLLAMPYAREAIRSCGGHSVKPDWSNLMSSHSI